MERAAYGTWKSPITSEVITKDTIAIGDLLTDIVTGKVYHLEKRPSEKGRNVLVNTQTSQDVLGAGWNVRTLVQEYGGASAVVHSGIVYFSRHPGGMLHKFHLEGGSEPEPVTPENVPYRYACMEVHPTFPHLLVSILEDHTIDTPTGVVTNIAIINTDNKKIHTVVSSADFYSFPAISPDGMHLTWQQWYHPDMPWEGALLYIGDIVINGDQIEVKNPRYIAGVQGEVSAQFARWADNDTLIYISDESGFMNPWKYSVSGQNATPVFPQPVNQDFGSPVWTLRNFPYTILQSGKTGLFTAWRDGRSVLYHVDLRDGSFNEVESPYTVITKVAALLTDTGDSCAVFSGEKATEGKSIVKWTASGSNHSFEILKPAEMAKLDGVPLPLEIISAPQPITLMLPGNIPLPVVYYPPQNPAYAGTSIQGERPPCILDAHGGPTLLTTQSLSWDRQYFTSRGWAWLDVNYGGSSGYGRKFIERLRGQWGKVDVDDILFAAKAISNAPYNLIDPDRIVIRGQSAGGYTALAAISLPDDKKVFAAATSFFGICDLKKCTETIHKYELRYLEKLIGGTYEEVPHIYTSQSPLFHANKIVTPLLILQGEIDRVVTKDQAEMIYESVKHQGGVVEIKIYPGEGHGWRQESSMKDSLERELGFYERVLKLKPS